MIINARSWSTDSELYRRCDQIFIFYAAKKIFQLVTEFSWAFHPLKGCFRGSNFQLHFNSLVPYRLASIRFFFSVTELQYHYQYMFNMCSVLRFTIEVLKLWSVLSMCIIGRNFEKYRTLYFHFCITLDIERFAIRLKICENLWRTSSSITVQRIVGNRSREHRLLTIQAELCSLLVWNMTWTSAKRRDRARARMKDALPDIRWKDCQGSATSPTRPSCRLWLRERNFQARRRGTFFRHVTRQLSSLETWMFPVCVFLPAYYAPLSLSLIPAYHRWKARHRAFS